MFNLQDIRFMVVFSCILAPDNMATIERAVSLWCRNIPNFLKTGLVP